ncbi:DUF2939 domain-containing protein [Kozakia baliensis]|nr:DUF2939 domain-containing protein [Kozakia baliensis]GEL65104.1 hypothetical protein KBA01_23900 [Kozakia baliensis]
MRHLTKLQFKTADGPTFSRSRYSRLPHAFGMAMLTIICIYALSPYIALWSINNALRSHDAQTLSSHIDWSALTHSLKEESVAAILGPPPAADDLPDFGSSFATNAVSHAIDTRLTPDTLLSLAGQLIPSNKGSTGSPSDILSHLSAHFVALTRFEARVTTTPGQAPTVVHMKFEHWRWQITRLEMPQAA